MTLFLSIMTVLVLVAVVLVAGMRPLPAALSRFELKRRGAHGELARLEVAQDIDSFLRVIESILLVVSVILLVITFGWVIGVLMAIVVAIGYGALAHVSFVRHQAQDVYEWKERSFVVMVNKAPRFFRIIRLFSFHELRPPQAINSREELQYLIDESGDVLSRDQKQLLVHGLAFEDKTVSEIMTPKSVIQTVRSTEFLGPLVLDELHKKGHSRLPVIKEDIDHVIGILHTNNLLTLDSKRSVTAEKAMEAKVYYIHEDDSLQHALAAFLRNHHQIFIVINDMRETVGMVTLTDVMEALIGHELSDEDDIHENIHAVAERNNHPSNHIDL